MQMFTVFYAKAKNLLLSVFFAAWGNLLMAQQVHSAPSTPEIWSRDFEPFRIAGNLYYVGTYDLACYLITTPKGHVLINTALESSEPMIRRHIEELGFQFSDIKIILATHAHFDHVGVIAAIKKHTGARLFLHEKEAQVMEDGGNSDFLFGGKGSLFPPAKVDRRLHDHDTVHLGEMNIVVLHHPGHTRGACSFLFDVQDKHRTYSVLIANMPSILDETHFPSMATYPEVAKDYAYTLQDLSRQHFDIWLSSHASQFGLHQKHRPGAAYHPESFIDAKGYKEAIASYQKDYEKKMQLH